MILAMKLRELVNDDMPAAASACCCKTMEMDVAMISWVIQKFWHGI